MMEEESMRVVALTLLTLILHIACSGNFQRESVIDTSPQTNPDQWQPYQRIPGGFRRNLVGDPRQPGPFKYQLNARVAAHQHSNEVNVKVLSGSMYIIIGEPLESSRALRFATGSIFVVPAQAWHEEWWDEETVLEADGVGPMETIYRPGEH